MRTEVKQTSNVVQEFSRFAHQYNQYNMIQAKVADTLVQGIPFVKYKNVIDIGCGSGSVLHNFQAQDISVEHFIAIDFAQAMLDIHPTYPYVSKICTNFSEEIFLSMLPRRKFDLLVSSSALQWSENIDLSIKMIASLSGDFHAAIFTSNTFKTLHNVARLKSPIHTIETLQSTIKKYYENVHFKVHQYQLSFSTTREMFKYIKQSGVSSGEKKLSYKKMKQIMAEYPLDYLEFEVLFIKTSRKA